VSLAYILNACFVIGTKSTVNIFVAVIWHYGQHFRFPHLQLWIFVYKIYSYGYLYTKYTAMDICIHNIQLWIFVYKIYSYGYLYTKYTAMDICIQNIHAGKQKCFIVVYGLHVVNLSLVEPSKYSTVLL